MAPGIRGRGEAQFRAGLGDGSSRFSRGGIDKPLESPRLVKAAYQPAEPGQSADSILANFRGSWRSKLADPPKPVASGKIEAAAEEAEEPQARNDDQVGNSGMRGQPPERSPTPFKGKFDWDSTSSASSRKKAAKRGKEKKARSASASREKAGKKSKAQKGSDSGSPDKSKRSPPVAQEKRSRSRSAKRKKVANQSPHRKSKASRSRSGGRKKLSRSRSGAKHKAARSRSGAKKNSRSSPPRKSKASRSRSDARKKSKSPPARTVKIARSRSPKQSKAVKESQTKSLLSVLSASAGVAVKPKAKRRMSPSPHRKSKASRSRSAAQKKVLRSRSARKKARSRSGAQKKTKSSPPRKAKTSEKVASKKPEKAETPSSAAAEAKAQREAKRREEEAKAKKKGEEAAKLVKKAAEEATRNAREAAKKAENDKKEKAKVNSEIQKTEEDGRDTDTRTKAKCRAKKPEMDVVPGSDAVESAVNLQTTAVTETTQQDREKKEPPVDKKVIEPSKSDKANASGRDDSVVPNGNGNETFHENQELLYFSAKFNTWVPCKVVKVDAEKDAIQINLKPGYWFKKSEREKKVRLPGEADASAGRCSVCSKRVLKEVGGVGGVLCRRTRKDGSEGGCGEGACWVCIKKAAPGSFGSIIPSKKEFAGLQASGKEPWWMHEKCMIGNDAAEYAAQFEPTAS